MGCGPSKTPSSGGPSGAETSPGNNHASTVQTVQSSKVSEKQLSRDIPQGTTTRDADETTAEQRDSCAAGTKTASKSTQMTIVHFNDVYNIEAREKEPVGGAARFATKLASFKHLNPLIVFSGDCLNPSTSEYAKACSEKVIIFTNHMVVFAPHARHIKLVSRL